GYRAVQSTPLIARDGRPLGMLSTHWRSPHRSSELDLHRLELYLRQAADFIERCNADRVMRESEDRLRMAMTAGQMGAWDVDLKTNRTQWDAKECSLLGLTVGSVEPGPKAFYRSVHPDDVPEVKRLVAEAMMTGTLRSTFRIILPDGQVRWLAGQGQVLRDTSGNPARMVGVNYDVTDRIIIEGKLRTFAQELEIQVQERTQELQVAQQRLSLAHQAARIGTFEWNIQTGVNVWTPELEVMYGLAPGEFAQTQVAWEHFLYPDDRDDAVGGVHHSLATGEPVEREFRVVWRNGSVRWLLGRWQMVRDQAGQPHRVTGVNIDITDRKLAKLALQDTTDRLRALATQLNLTEQRERRRLADELHDHLQQMLVLGKLTIGQGKRFAVGIPGWEKMIHQLDDVLSDALRYSRTLVAELSPPVLHHHGLGAGLKWLADDMKRYDLVVMVTVPAEEVWLPEEQMLLLFQSVRELLINSAKHAGTGQADVTLAERNGHLHITVHDDGAGFDLAAAAAAAAAPATPTGGLSSKFGMFSIRERMVALGGTFTVQTAPGKGTRATLVLPLTRPGPYASGRCGGSLIERSKNSDQALSR
ncbi:MAG: PAS domain-containing sensor histidine kinase, partial [Nitrospira sp.]